jgi:hypothetical protein
MGRQLCVIAIVFLISQLTNFPSMPSLLPSYLQNVLIGTGLPGVMLTLIIGQLFPQLIADEYTIRFLNIRGSLFFIKIAEQLEHIGVFTNCSWVVAYILTHFIFRWNRDGSTPEGDVENPLDSLDIGASTHNLLLKLKESYPHHAPMGSSDSRSDSGRGSEHTTSTGGRTVELTGHSKGRREEEGGGGGGTNKSNLNRYQEYNTTPSSAAGKQLLSLQTNATALNIDQLNPSKSGLLTSSATLLKLLVSTIFTGLAASIIIYGVMYQKPIMKLHPVALLVILSVCMLCEFYLEGLQVAVLAMQHRDRSTIPASLTGTLRIHHYLTEDKTSEVVKRFLIGRQFLVVFSMFTMASITSYESHEHFNVAIIPRKVTALFILSGFCGVVFALNTVQLPAQILAKQYPMLFLNLPGVLFFFRLTLLIEQTGIMHFGWILFHCSKGVFQND